MAVRCERDVGCAAEIITADRGLAADRDLEQLFSFGRELQDFRTGSIRRPHVPLWIKANSVRHDEQALAPGSEHLAVAVEAEDRISLVPALEEVQKSSLTIHGHP